MSKHGLKNGFSSLALVVLWMEGKYRRRNAQDILTTDDGEIINF